MKPKTKYPLVPVTKAELSTESRRLTRLVKGKIVKKVFRHRAKEVGIEFTDGTRIFVDYGDKGLETSLT